MSMPHNVAESREKMRQDLIDAAKDIRDLAWDIDEHVKLSTYLTPKVAYSRAQYKLSKMKEAVATLEYCVVQLLKWENEK